MNNNKKITIKAKLFTLVLVSTVTILLLGIAGYTMLRSSQNSLNEALSVRMVNLDLLGDAGIDIHQALVAERTMFSLDYNDEDFQKKLDEEVETIYKSLEQSGERITQYREQLTEKDAEAQALLEAYDGYRIQWEDHIKTVIGEAQNQDLLIRIQGFKKSMNQGMTIFDNMEEVLDQVADDYSNEGQALAELQMRRGKQVTSLLIIILLLGIACILTIGYITSKGIVRNINSILGTLNKIKDGDMQVECKTDSNDELKDISDSINVMVENISVLLGNVKNTADTLKVKSIDIGEVSALTMNVIDEVALAINEVSLATQSQAEDISLSVDLVMKLGENIETIRDLSEIIMDVSRSANELSSRGIKVVDTLTNKTEQANVQTNNVSSVISEMGKASGEISTIVETISAISSQTNLLSLNASIEAARAGEAGRGFAVVAGEIRLLAEQTDLATKQIQALIDNLNQRTKQATRAVGESKEVIADQNKSVLDTKDTFVDISALIQQLDEEIHKIAISTQEVDGQKNDTISKMHNIAAISEENAASSEEVLASTEEATANMAEFNREAEELQELSELSEENLSKFKI